GVLAELPRGLGVVPVAVGQQAGENRVLGSFPGRAAEARVTESRVVQGRVAEHALKLVENGVVVSGGGLNSLIRLIFGFFAFIRLVCFIVIRRWVRRRWTADVAAAALVAVAAE